MRTAKIVVDLSREHGLATYLGGGEVYTNWARARLGDHESRTTGLKQALAAYIGQRNKLHAPIFHGLVAEVEAEAGDADRAVRRIDEALALANKTGARWTDALLHRIRGEILLKRDSDPHPPRKPSSPPSPSPSRELAASNCAPRSASPSSTARPAATATAAPSSIQRSKASRRRRNFRKSPRRGRCSRRWRLSYALRRSALAARPGATREAPRRGGQKSAIAPLSSLLRGNLPASGSRSPHGLPIWREPRASVVGRYAPARSLRRRGARAISRGRFRRAGA